MLVDEVKRLTGDKGAISSSILLSASTAELCEAAAQDANIFAYGGLQGFSFQKLSLQESL